MSPGFQITDIPNLKGYVAIVTGGNSGIGFETSLRLALKSSRVYIAARSRKRVDEAITKMRESCKEQLDLRFLELDLQSLESVKNAAAEFMKQESRLDLLINNAGVMAVPYKLTADGFETHWQTNYLAPHLLFLSLLPVLQSTAAESSSKSRVRVVNVASDTVAIAPKAIEYADVNMPNASGPPTAPWKRYAHSKMALMIQARAIHNRYHSEGISAFSLHPGIAATNLQSADPTLFGTLIRKMVRWHIVPGYVSVADSARTTLFCATSPDAVKSSGQFIFPYGKINHGPDKWTNDDKATRELWEKSGIMLKDRGY